MGENEKQPHEPKRNGRLKSGAPVYDLTTLPRCDARAKRTGRPCRRYARKQTGRCRLHGGAWGAGAPYGNENALKHGFYTYQAIKERRQIAALLRQMRDTFAALDTPEF